MLYDYTPNIDFSGQKVLIIGGTGSLGACLLKALLELQVENKNPSEISIFSRDEAKQFALKNKIDQDIRDGVYLPNVKLHFIIGDVRNPASLFSAVRGKDIVVNAAALKQVPTCEYFPEEAVKTNVNGAINLVNVIEQLDAPPSLVIGISTDKACHPVNTMGLTKALQEKTFISANLKCPDTRFVIVRYGNVLASRGSVIPMFHTQIRNNQSVTITDFRCTRFFLSLDDAINVIMYACEHGQAGDIIVPKIYACNMLSLARCLIGERDLIPEEIGCRPGEKIHEVLVAEDEIERTTELVSFFIISPALDNLKTEHTGKQPTQAYSSDQNVLSDEALTSFLKKHKMTLEDHPEFAL